MPRICFHLCHCLSASLPSLSHAFHVEVSLIWIRSLSILMEQRSSGMELEGQGNGETVVQMIVRENNPFSTKN